MKNTSCRAAARAALALTFAFTVCLTACGGGNGKPDVVLSIDDGQAEAYTARYLDEHPEMLVQPEHLIVAALDPARAGGVAVRLFVREDTQVSIDSDDSTAATLADISIFDAAGRQQLQHRHGGGAATALLVQGSYRVVFHPSPARAAAMARVHLAYLKLADTSTQAQRRGQRGLPSAGLGAVPSARQALGVASSGSCIGCSFDGANLNRQSFAGENLQGSTFFGASIDGTDFSGVQCVGCTFLDVHVDNLHVGGFDNANMAGSTMGGLFTSVNFRGANFVGATLGGGFLGCDFGPAPDGSTTDFTNADMSAVQFINWVYGGGVRYANFENTKGSLRMFASATGDANDKMVGARFVNTTPANLFAGQNFGGMDLTGVNFTGMDLSGADLSTANRVTLSPTTDLWHAMLTNGQSGTNLSGQNFENYSKFAGTFDGKTAGKDLRGVNLSGARLFEADLTGTNLAGANLIGADLTNASLYKASLVGAQLGVAPGGGAGAAAILIGSYMVQTDLTDADLRSVKFDNAHLYGGVKFVRARLDSASMAGALLADADFSQASLSATNFVRAVLVNANFAGANLVDADMTSAYLQGANFVDTQSVAGLALIDAYVSTASGNWKFTEVDGTPFSYGYGATAIGDLGSTARGTAVCPSGEPGPCLGDALQPGPSVPYPPPPPASCIPAPPDYDNCLPPKPPA